MQNYKSKTYNINSTKIINIKSEILCREAEDDFYYFNDVNSAYKKLNKAVELTPYHLKSLILLADITFIKGNIKKALLLYKRAEKIAPKNAKILASIANCLYNIPVARNEALLYCEKAINNLNMGNQNLFSQVMEIKINIFILKKNYKEAYKAYIHAQSAFDRAMMMYNINYKMLSNKINLQKKLQNSKLKIV